MHGTMMDFPLTLDRVLERAGSFHRDVEIVSRRPDRSLHRSTYGAFYARARKLAEALTRAGLRKGDRVATLAWNHVEHLEAYFGIPAAGGVLHTLNLRLHPDDLAYIATHAGDRFVIVDDVLLPLLEKFRARTAIEKVFVVPTTGAAVAEPYVSYEALLASATGEFSYPELDENDPVGMCYTSGTTGQPKGVVYTHRSTVLHSLASASGDALGVRRKDSLVAVVPMFHANAWGLPYTATMAGAKQVLPGPHLDAASLLELFEAERTTIAAGVPTIWLGILEALDKEPQRYKLQPGLRMVVGGSAAPAGMIRGFDRHGLTVLHAWGMTETSPLGSVSNVGPEAETMTEDQRYTYRALQGQPVPFVEVRARSEQGFVPWDGVTPGELEVRGPWVAASYYNNPDAADRWTQDGWFKTGDVVSLDSRGFIKISDRTKDLIKSGGEWISSVDLENALMGHPAVREAAVVGAPHAKWVERPVAVVALKTGAAATAHELREYLGKHHAKWWVPDAVVFVDQIPRTSAGKFLKSELRKRFEAFDWSSAAEPASGKG